jgi:hypothetical protein|uniref:Uncharacterized protein n=1 Tax=Siphoviridae sp. ctP6113 TaxID=2826318 RepID=A0A8S5MTN3_9CAUD|nr:MAG TPA: hypothetical protein [Siphoviridae sp. ctP6113]
MFKQLSTALKEKMELLELVQEDGNQYSWAVKKRIWASVDLSSGQRNLFSSIGIGARNADVIVRENASLTLHNALRWNGQFLFLTSLVVGEYHDRLELKAALVTPTNCIATWTPKDAKDTLNRPIEGTPEIVTFPGVLTEKYRGNEPEDVYRILTQRRVLVTPKAIRLRAGTVVQTPDGADYTVRAVMDLDEWKNEYEIEHQEDV